MRRDGDRRDLAIDATRGLAIWSMISLHFGGGTDVAEPTHSFPYVDGMSAFVMLSGLVLGIVYGRWIERESLSDAYRKLAKRLVVLYLCQLLIALVAVAAAMAGHRWLTLLLPIDGWADGVRLAVTMQYLPSGGNILLLYLVLLASTFVLFPLLMRGWWAWILVASALLYVVSQFDPPAWFYLSAYQESPQIQNWAAWQVMFVPALVLGWKWRDWQIPELVDRYLPALLLAAAAVWVVFHYAVDTGPLVAQEHIIADKLNFGPLRAIGAWVVVPSIYGLFRVVLRHTTADVLRPLVMTGSRSLDSYVLQAIALVIVPIHVAHRPWALVTTIAVAVLVFGLCWGWAELRKGLGIAKLHQLPQVVWGLLRPARPRPAPTARAETPPSPSEPEPEPIGTAA